MKFSNTIKTVLKIYQKNVKNSVWFGTGYYILPRAFALFARIKRNKSEKLLAVYNSLSISFFSGVNTNVAFYWQPCSTLLDTLLLITLTKMATATRNYKKQKFWSH